MSKSSSTPKAPPSEDKKTSQDKKTNPSSPLAAAKCCLAQALDGITFTPEEREICAEELQILDDLKRKLEHHRLAIAVFGVVGRGKSATINALLGRKAVATGAAHGTTQTGNALTWTLKLKSRSNPEQHSHLTLELLDTPGLNDVAGETRDRLAFDVARLADLILFVVSGDITDYENRALIQLRQLQKPILLAFNKIDLYPDCDRQSIYEQLTNPKLRQLLTEEDVVLIAASPKPEEIQVEDSNGRVEMIWEEKPAVIHPLKKRLISIARREGESLIALNILRAVDELRDRAILKKLQHQDNQLSQAIWRFVGIKSTVVLASPFAIVDLLAAIAIDLATIRALSQTTGIALSRHGAAPLLKNLALCWLGLLAAELSTTLLISSGSLGISLPNYGTAGITQAVVAGLTGYLITQSTRDYLQKSCDEALNSPKQTIKSLLSKLERGSILGRIRQELNDKLMSNVLD